jgi:DNA repair exonuclease SbcCD ATPase subunit
MLIKEISLKNFKSFGNNTQKITLNQSEGQLILLVGGNGFGKSLKSTATIDVVVDLLKVSNEDREVLEMYIGYKSDATITLELLNFLQTKINILDKYDVLVNTQNGYKKIKAIGITSPNSKKINISTKSFDLSGSPYHRIIKNDVWIFLKDLMVDDYILTKNGYEGIISIEHDNEKEDLWDIEVDGSEYYSNGIVSHNSSLLESFEYVLYNKVISNKKKKKSNLDTLPNRINGGDLLVNIKFSSEGNEIEVERGISPNVLKLIENGIPNDRAGKTNLNEKIEKYVGMDIEAFKSFISLSINDFKNFISLSTEEKQILLDKLFNLEVINLLNNILKELNKTNKSTLIKHDAEINTLQESISSIQKSIQKSLEREKEDIKGEIDTIKAEMSSKKDEYTSLKEKCDKIKNKDIELKNEIDKEKEQYNNLQNDLKNVNKEIDLYNLGKCPTCATDFYTEHFTTLKDVLLEKKKTVDNLKKGVEENIKAIKEKQTKLQTMSDSANTAFNDITYLLKNYKSQLEKLNAKVDDVKPINLNEFQNSINDLNLKKEQAAEYLAECKEKELYYKELAKIFGEDGVKKEIIAGLIKPINYYIAENIKEINFPYQLVLDENFNATIKQFGAEVEQDSLSTGENKLANLIIYISYSMMIKTKNFINILFLDEIFASMDLDNIEKILYLLKIFASKFNVSIFVVHHAILNREYFDRIIQIRKNVFSEIIEVIE